MKIVTATLTGLPLDYAAAVAMGIVWQRKQDLQGALPCGRSVLVGPQQSWSTQQHQWSPSTVWDDLGPLLPRHGVLVGPSPTKTASFVAVIGAGWSRRTGSQEGSTYQEAATRCIVAASLGPIVEVPEEVVARGGPYPANANQESSAC